MRVRLPVLLGAVLLAACEQPAPRTVARADTPRAALLGTVSGPPGVQSTVTTTPPPPYDSATVAEAARIGAELAADLTPIELSDDTRATCHAVADTWKAVAGVRLTSGSATLRPADYLGDSVISQRNRGPRVVACVVEAYVAQEMDAVAHVRRPWRGDGWADLSRISADGADGGMTTHQRGRTRCEIQWQVPFGDGPDDTTTLAPFYKETATCWTHWRDVVPIDTAYLGG